MAGFFAVGHFAVKKKVNFGRLGRIRLSSVRLFFDSELPTAKNSRAVLGKGPLLEKDIQKRTVL